MKSKVIVYPVTEMAMPVLKELKNSEHYEIVSAVMPKTWLLIEKDNVDVGNINNSEALGIKASNDFFAELEKCDVVIILECSKHELMYKDVIRKIEKSLRCGKKIVCCFELKDNDVKFLNKVSDSNNAEFDYRICGSSISKDEYGVIDEYKSMSHQDATMVGIGKMVNELESTYSLITFTEEYKIAGYDVVAISTNRNCELLGYEMFPTIFIDKGISDSDKVTFFNNYIALLEKKYKPDIIFVQYPDAMMKYNQYITNGFGMCSYMISQSVDMDYFIMNVSFNGVEKKFYDLLSECFKHRFGYEIDCLCMSNAQINVDESREKRVAVLNWMPQSYVDEVIDEIFIDSKYDTYNVLDSVAGKKAIYESIKKLSGYEKTI